MHDIETRDDIDALMRDFYGVVMTDPVIGHFFTKVVRLDLDHHLPIIGDFWESALFATGTYARHGRNPLGVHLDLHAKEPLRPEHFARWLELFDASVNRLFSGKRADFARQRARGIALRFLSVMEQVPPRGEGASPSNS